MPKLLSQLSYEQLRLLAQCTCVILVAALLMYGLLPQLRAHQALQAEIDVHERKLQGPRVQETDITSLRSENEALRETLIGADSSLPVRQLESRVLRRLHLLAKESGIRLSRVQPERDKLDDDLLQLQFEVEAVGTYSQCAQWLEALDSPASNAVLDSFTLEPEDPRGQRLRSRARILSYHLVGGAS